MAMMVTSSLLSPTFISFPYRCGQGISFSTYDKELQLIHFPSFKALSGSHGSSHLLGLNVKTKINIRTTMETGCLGKSYLGNRCLGNYNIKFHPFLSVFSEWNGCQIGNSSVENKPVSVRFAVNAVVKKSPKRLKYAANRRSNDDNLLYLEVDPFDVDATRLEPIAAIIKNGGIGVIPTDTVYAIVCDLKNRAAVERLYRVKNMDPKKPLSIVCRSFQDIDTYTLGFPRGNGQGQTNIFRAARQCLPGPYTFILKASKDMPKQCITFGGGLAAQCAPRKSVGVRMPKDLVCQTLLEQLDEPLLCTSVTQQNVNDWLLDPALIAENYGSGGINERVDFIVDAGLRVADPSTVIDMTGDRPILLRQGKGMLEDWMVTESLSGVNPYEKR